MNCIEPKIPPDQVDNQYVATQIMGEYDSLSEEEKKKAYIILSECRNINDVSSLANVHTLYLLGCTGITDVSALGDVQELYIHGCTGITDVSALGCVYKLSLSYCTGITDVSMLIGVKELYLPENIPQEQIAHLRNHGVDVY